MSKKNRVIGNNNELLWHVPEDLKRFKKLTLGHPIIMGRKTFESILNILGGPLPKRTNIVITRNKEYSHIGVKTASSLKEAFEIAQSETPSEIHIGGGAQIYTQALPFVDKIFATYFFDEKEGDAYFPEFEQAFEMVKESPLQKHNDLTYQWVDYVRKNEVVKKVEAFVQNQFKEYPHFSFNDWKIMYNHSLTVRNLALRISMGMSLDRIVIEIGSLLHDIGKTHIADEDTLHTNHEDFNWPVSKNFLYTLDLDTNQLSLLENILQHNSSSTEMKIIEDADALALYADKKLYTLYIEWARENNLDVAIQRKLDKFEQLNFDISKRIGRKWFEKMKTDWKTE
jgi:dihydrofolate reductase